MTFPGYRLIKEISRTEGSTVIKAVDVKTQRVVALKILSATLSEEAKARLIRTARLVSELDHPNICRICAVGEVGSQVFVAMDYIDGESLASRMRARPLTVESALDICIQIASGLQRAHEHGLIHRDIRPSNIIVIPDNHVEIIDFGCAFSVASHLEPRFETFQPARQYESPEQYVGRECDQRTDIWALGVLMYEALTGELPFTGSNAETILEAMLTCNPSLTPRSECIPPKIKDVIAKALAKRPRDRYDSVMALAADLRHIARRQTRSVLPSQRFSTTASIPEGKALSFSEATDLEDVVLQHVLTLSDAEIDILASECGCGDQSWTRISSIASSAASLYRARGEKIPPHVVAALGIGTDEL